VADVICASVAGITDRAELTDEPERVRGGKPAGHCAMALYGAL
jgi:hypothetical protein